MISFTYKHDVGSRKKIRLMLAFYNEDLTNGVPNQHVSDTPVGVHECRRNKTSIGSTGTCESQDYIFLQNM
jgi:hypothetical protein